MTYLIAPVVFNPDVHKNDLSLLHIGRSTQWGNPYRICGGISRSTSLIEYEKYVLNGGLYPQLGQLSGKKLVCPGRCNEKGQACHGDVLVRLWKERFQ